MTTPDAFGAAYAEAYDRLYATKDYAAECAFVHAAARRYGRGTRLLDLGCGTGHHALRLADLGYTVTGIDRSEAMLAQARAKAAASPAAARLSFASGDIASYRAGATFDVVTMLFAVIGYQVEDAAARATFETIRAHLEPGGLLVFDCWYGPAVLALKPSDRTKQIDHAGGTLIRAGRGALDTVRRCCTVDYALTWRPVDGPEQRTTERHVVRFFFAEELAQLLAGAGLALRELRDFDAPERPPSETSWNVWCVAQAV